MNGKQLKNSILQWAIQGKLVPQDPNDEPASVLLEKIRAEKARLVKEGKLKKKDLDVKPIVEDETPFEIPKGWEWCRLNDCLDVRDGTHDTPKYVAIGYPLVTSKNLRNGIIDFKGALLISKEDHEAISCRSRVDENDILFAMIGSIGNPVLVRHKETDFSIKNMALFKHIDDLLSMEYVYWFLCVAQADMKEYASGGVQSFVSLGYLRNYLIPLPPLAEQRRIVAKIEELMPLVEKYGENQEALEEWNNSLPEKLKKSILQEAIQGKLVPQDPADEPASVLQERIREEKRRLVEEGKLKKKDLEVKPIEEEEVPFEIPESWEWCGIEDITLPIGNKSNQIQSKEVLNEGDVPVVSQGQKLIDGYSNEINKTIKELPVIMFGDHTRNVKLIDFPFVIGADGTKFFKPILCEAQYLYYVVLYVASKLRDRGYARHYTLLKEEPLPLPPLAEQRRIVEKIEELFGVIKK